LLETTRSDFFSLSSKYDSIAVGVANKRNCFLSLFRAFIIFFGERTKEFFITKEWEGERNKQGCQMVHFETKDTYLGKFLGSCN
jgi:hypothetical protein